MAERNVPFVIPSSGVEIDLCPDLPKMEDPLKIRLPFGGELTAVRDFSKGIPDDCSMVFNLLGQLPPLLGSLDCLLKILNAIGKVGEFAQAVPSLPTDPAAVGTAVTELVEAIGELSDCLPPVAFPKLAFTICDILRLIAKLLSCMVEFLESIVESRHRIQFSAAEDNPDLLNLMNCADENAKLSVAHVMSALQPITPLLNSVKPLVDLSGLPVELPNLADISGDGDPAELLAQLRGVTTTINDIVESICPP